MTDLASHIKNLQDDFQRIADRAPSLRARFIIKGGTFGLFVLGSPTGDGPGDGMVCGLSSGQDAAFVSELHTLTDQAGALAEMMHHSRLFQGKTVSLKTVQYNLREPRDWWLFLLLHVPPFCFQCWANRPDGSKFPAVAQLGESEIAVWIDNYPQICVSALGWLKAAAPAATGPKQSGLPVQWEGDGWNELEPQVRRLLQFMNGREESDLYELCAEVWGKDFAEVSDSALSTTISKANNFLGKRQPPRILRRVRGENRLRWK